MSIEQLLASKNLQALEQKLKEGGKDINHQDETGNTALIEAAQINYLEGVKLLLSFGASPKLFNNNKDTPLHVGIRDLQIVKVLLDHEAPIDFQNLSGETPLHKAIEVMSLEVIEFLLERGASVLLTNTLGESALHAAVLKGEIKPVQWIVGKGADINLKNSLGDVPLHLAMKDENQEILEYLINLGANVNILDCDNEYPLQHAVYDGNVNLVKLLIHKHADIPTKDAQGYSILEEAIRLNHFCIARLLIKAGANINHINNKGKSILHCAVKARNLDFVKYLLEHGVNIDVTDKNKVSPLYVAIVKEEWSITRELIENGANLYGSLVHGNTILHHFVEHNQVDLVKLILNSKFYVNVNARNIFGCTPLLFAVCINNWYIVKELLDHGANVDLYDYQGNTPLHDAAVHSQYKIFLALIEKSSNLNFQEFLGRDAPIHRAISTGDTKKVLTLLDWGAMGDLSNHFNHVPSLDALPGNRKAFNDHKTKLEVLDNYILKKDGNCFGHFKKACRQEIDLMEKAESQNYSVFSLMLKDCSPNIVTNSFIADEISVCENKYPIYCNILKKNFKKAKQMYEISQSRKIKIVSSKQ